MEVVLGILAGHHSHLIFEEVQESQLQLVDAGQIHFVADLRKVRIPHAQVIPYLGRHDHARQKKRLPVLRTNHQIPLRHLANTLDVDQSHDDALHLHLGIRVDVLKIRVDLLRRRYGTGPFVNKRLSDSSGRRVWDWYRFSAPVFIDVSANDRADNFDTGVDVRNHHGRVDEDSRRAVAPLEPLELRFVRFGRFILSLLLWDFWGF
mmetsp:Transcript_39543/g.53730  ORF Transcript_39543/g.53730 Transcript_39543/m.53730 type:complete len:206 (-) Transcript_39543:418-1035(-)